MKCLYYQDSTEFFQHEASVRKESVGVNGQRILNQAGLRCDATATFLFCIKKFGNSR